MNSIDGDGMKNGYDLELLKRIKDAVGDKLAIIGDSYMGYFTDHMIGGVLALWTAWLAIVLGGIGFGFWKGGMGMGADMLLTWAMFTGGLAGLGALLAASHPLSILTAIVVAPFKPFRLSIPTGAFAALVETRLRKPTYQDFLQLRDDAQNVKGWYRNRVTRVVLTFMLTNLGSMLGLWLTGFSVYGKLAG